MKKYTAKNERIKEEYYRYLEQVDGKSRSTLDGIRKALVRFEEYNRYKDFATFNKEQAIAFKKHLLEMKAVRTGEPLNKHTVLTTLKILQAFFKWLALQDGYKSRIDVLDTGYFNLTEKDTRIAQSRKMRPFPTLEQIRAAIKAMPTGTDLEKRDRALVATAIITGARDSALISLKLKHLDVHNGRVEQYPDEVKTKRSKTIISGFFPVGDDLHSIVLEWAAFLKQEKLFSPNDPLFPKTEVMPDITSGFRVVGLSKEHWSNTTPVRKVFQGAFTRANLPYFNPHSFRQTLGHIAKDFCINPEEFKAWSQNLGHENVLTTLTSYGYLDPIRQCEVMKGMGKSGGSRDAMSMILERLDALAGK